jgi:hypothetical protein
MSTRVCVMLGARSVTAVWPAGGRDETWSQAVDGLGDLPAAIADLASRAPKGASLVVAILPPLARTRDVPLPPMTTSDRESAIARASRRYFVGMPEDVVCAVSPRSSIVHVVGAELLGSIVKACTASGLEVERIVPATELWARRQKNGTVVVGGDEVTTLTVENGQIAAIRRSRAIPGEVRDVRVDPTQISRFAPNDIPEFVANIERSRRRALERKWSRMLIGAAAASLIGAAIIHQAGLSRERAALVREREALRPRVVAALAQRDSLLKQRATLQAVSALERTSPRWSAVVGRVAGALPRDASLAGMRAEGDSVSLDGEAQNAAGVFTALRTAHGILAVHPAAPIRQEAGPNATPIERWTLNARVDHAVAVERSRR